MKVIVRPSGIYINGSRYNYTMLDNMIKRPVDLIDIDMYGSEIDVLKGAVKTLDMYRPKLDITLHEGRIMKERERVIGLLALGCNLPIDITDTHTSKGDKLHVIIQNCPVTPSEWAVSYFRGHKFEYYRYKGPEAIMYFTGWTSEVKLREKLLRPDEVVYDIGAHIGGWTIPAALISKYVYAFEPNIDCVKILKANISLNKLQNKVYVYNTSLGGKINSCFNDNNTDVISKLDEYAIMSPNLIKIDVEGAELDVIRGAEETIKKFKPRIFVEAHIIDGHNTYDKIIKTIMELIPDYHIEFDKGTYCIFTP